MLIYLNIVSLVFSRMNTSGIFFRGWLIVTSAAAIFYLRKRNRSTSVCRFWSGAAGNPKLNSGAGSLDSLPPAELSWAELNCHDPYGASAVNHSHSLRSMLRGKWWRRRCSRTVMQATPAPVPSPAAISHPTSSSVLPLLPTRCTLSFPVAPMKIASYPFHTRRYPPRSF